MGFIDGLSLVCWECGKLVMSLEAAKKHQDENDGAHDSWVVR